MTRWGQAVTTTQRTAASSVRAAALEEVPVETLAIDEFVVVRPNERLPADGFVMAGASSVDQAPITGESVPVDKSAVQDPARAAAAPDDFAGVVVDEPFSGTFYRTMAVLVAASPCALAIATPSAVLSGIARAARGGVLVKGGGPLEELGRLEAIAFDKTGTLSDHPLAAAIVRDGRERLSGTAPAEATDLASITGRGVRATVDNRTVHIGKDELFAEIDGPGIPDALRTAVEALEAQGRTTIYVRHGERWLGAIGTMDTPREAAARVIARLRDIGIRRMTVIAGDNQQVADAVAREVGLDEAHGDLMPDDKVETIRQLRSKGRVAMVGDGVNDAPAMANATVGIAMESARRLDDLAGKMYRDRHAL